MIQDRVRGRDAREIARAFHRAVAVGPHDRLIQICQVHGIETKILSGVVFQKYFGHKEDASCQVRKRQDGQLFGCMSAF